MLKKGNKKKQMKNDEMFIIKAKAKHGNKFDYSKMVYVNSITPITIICPMHGEFTQRPSAHLLYDCPSCSGVKKKTTEEFIQEAKNLYGDKYTYGKSVYKGNKQLLTITCVKHGDFEQRPNGHLRGQGCPKCYLEKLPYINRLTQEDFLNRAIEIHGNFYNYDKVVYDGIDRKVIITCPIHGDFEQTPNTHIGIKKTKCPKCSASKRGLMSRTSKEDFLIKANAAHRDKYGYDKLPDELRMSAKYPIYCKKCGVYFDQLLVGHVGGEHSKAKGHKACYEVTYKSEPRDEEYYRERIVNIHKDRYIYGPIVGTGKNRKIHVWCKEHGLFIQSLTNHLKGYGCFKCSRETAIEKTRYAYDEYVAKARSIHGDKFDYSLVKFKTVNDDIDIICPVHGNITQRANGHLKYGCAKCHSDSKIIPKDVFIQRANEVHDNKYDYSEMEYNKTSEKIKIICKEHGPFKQHGGEHLRGSGCPICRSSRGELKIAKMLQKLDIPFIKEFSFTDSTFRYDFKLVNENILIEFDGEQHFRPVKLWGDEEQFKKQLFIDVEKNILAKLNNCLLIRIPYYRFDTLHTYLLDKIDKHFKYYYNNKFYQRIRVYFSLYDKQLFLSYLYLLFYKMQMSS